MLTKCVNCGFYLRQTDEFCLNCGIESPTREYSQPSPNLFIIARLTKSKLLFLILSVIICFLLFYLITDGELSSIPYLRSYVAFAIIVFSVAISFLLMFLITKWCDKKAHPKRLKNSNNFASRRKTVDKRLSELDKRAKTIDKILAEIGENSSSQFKDMRPKLMAAREVIIGQFARYELQKQKIELVRLQNGVSPYLFGLHRLNEFQTENGLVTIETARAEISQIRQNLTRYDAIDFPPKALPEKQAFLAQLDETENSCQKLREALLSRQAARALQDISPVEESVRLPISKELAHESDVFNIQTTLTDFSESFDELEREYKRIRAEEETERRLLAE